jgi:hypothetical protein
LGGDGFKTIFAAAISRSERRAGVAALAIGLLPKFSASTALISEADAAEVFEVTHSDSEWHAILSDEQYDPP